MGPLDVVIQVGAYLPVVHPDEFVFGPQIVIYGDGSAFADVFEPTDDGQLEVRQYQAQLDEDQIQQLLREARDLPEVTEVGIDGFIDDGFSSRLIANDQEWTVHDYDIINGQVPELDGYDEDVRSRIAESIPFADFVATVRSTVRGAEIGPWVPVLWVEREFSDECSAVSSSKPESPYSAPIFPHLVETVAIAPPAPDCALVVSGT